MTLLKRAQIGKANGIDVTVKSASDIWRAFAPTWEMVMGLKNGKLSEDEYRKRYSRILDRVPAEVWDRLARQDEAVLLCYCRDGWFCHTHLIIDHAVRNWPDRFQDGR